MTESTPVPPAAERADTERLWWVRALRVLFAVIGALALIAPPTWHWGEDWFRLSDYLSYFTILSNLAAVVVLLIGACAAPGGPRWGWVRGAVATAMTVTGIVYAILLAHLGQASDWTNDVVHRVMPVVIVLDWILLRPRSLPPRSWLTWLIFPGVYTCYTMLRGPIADWYPYPFFDPRQVGYPSMAISIAVLFAAMTGLSYTLYRLGTRGSHDRP